MITGLMFVFNNRTEASFMIEQGNPSPTMYTLAGMAGFYQQDGGNEINFYYSVTNGTITANTTVAYTEMNFNFFAFPELVLMYS